MTMGKLDGGDMHLLRLTARGATENGGWAKVSRVLMPVVQRLPIDLIEVQPQDDGSGLARLTERGVAVMMYS